MTSKCKTLVRTQLGNTLLTLIATQPDHPQVQEAIAKARLFKNGMFAHLPDEGICELIVQSIAKHPATCPTCHGDSSC